MKKIYRDLTGQKFGRLTVIRRAEDKIVGNTHYKMWECMCDCGNKKITYESNLIYGKTKSCGCITIELNKQSKPINYDLESYDYGVCFLNNNRQFIFDKEDFEKINKYHWTSDNRYVHTKVDGKKIYVHRLLVDAEGYENKVDHINHDTFDNRKCNLRIVSNSKNLQNGKTRQNNTSGLTGVFYHKRDNKWKAIICYENKNITLGTFDTKEEAQNARLKAEEEYFGEYSYRNSMEQAKEFNVK